MTREAACSVSGADRQGRSRLAAGRRPGWLAGWLGWIAVGALLIAIGAGWYLLPVGDWLGALRGWIADLGLIGVVLFAAIYAIGTVFLMPGSVLTITAGFAYGFWGLPIVLVAATIGASLAFLVGRYAVRDRVRRLLETRRNIAAIDNAIAAEGWKIVLLLRLSPLIPFNLQNYVFGITAIPFPHYLAATFAGIIPGTALYVYIGALGDMAAGAGPATWAIFGFGLLATAFVVVLVTRKARALLREAGVDVPALGDEPEGRA